MALGLGTTLFADDAKTKKEVNNLSEMFSEGETSGQIRLGYGQLKEEGDKTKSATAAGGQLKYKTGSLMGLSFGAAMYTSHSISPLSGSKDDKFYDDMASSKGSYTELGEAYLNFEYEGFNFRGGRQLIDTPLADSDDIRMTPHTFEAYIASYTFEDLGLSFIAGNVLSWQGVNTEADDEPYANVINRTWDKTGDNGTRLGAITYENDFVEASAWYYDITKNASAVYADVVGTITINDDVEIAVGAQYLAQKEKNDSDIDGSIIGAMVEANLYGVTAKAAYNKVSVDDGKTIFEEFGGGSSYTNIDTMTAETLHADGDYGDGSSYMVGLGYEIDDLNLFVEYGDYKADAIADGKAHVTEINFGVEYAFNQAELILMYAIGKDKEADEKTEFDNNRFQVVVNYNF